MVTIRQTLTDLNADLLRRILLEGKKKSLFSCLAVLLKRGMVSVISYRIGRFLIYHRLGLLYRLINSFEQFYTKNEISPMAQLGPGLVLCDNGGIGISKATITGKNCTFLGCNTTTLGAMEGFDLNKDFIVIGDHCVIGPRVRIMRPITMANGTQIKANSVVLASVKKVGVTISGVPAKPRNIDSYDEITQWNPLHGGFICKVNQ